MPDPIHPTIAAALQVQGHGAKSRLARAVGVKPQAVTKWVNGETTPPPDRWLDIEDALELPRFTLAKVSGMYESLDLGELDERRGEDRWRATFAPMRRPGGAALPTLLAARLQERILAEAPELAALPAGSAARVHAYERLSAVAHGVGDALADVVDGPVIDQAAAIATRYLMEALAEPASVTTVNYDEVVDQAVAAGDWALAAERGDISQLDDESDPRGESDRPQPPPVDTTSA